MKHRKPRQRPLSGGTVRTAATTLALAGAATATAFEGSSTAEPRLTPAQVKAKVDTLYQEAEAATEKYNGAKERTDRAQRRLDALRDEAARKTEKLNTARGALGSLAASQYRTGSLGPALQLAMADDPQEYLERAALIERAGDRSAAGIAAVRQRIGEVRALREKADGTLAELRAQQDAAARHKKTVEGKLTAARQLLARLTAEERARYAAQKQAGEGTGTPGRNTGTARPDRGAPPAGRPAVPGSRAAQAVAFAYGAIGRPYVWGATGPRAFDCSGLTQAAWRAAGVSLPRTTYTQINAGRRISRSQLAPGDLVFFYSGISHVGLYIGGGKMIHAPRPGSTVRIAPIDEMPWAGATRPV
ncbi:NlpC/P60 family protein [Streptomyces bambusae]|uniref:C40 family peptidase n=1 Tax=Streptomyces bambusae TaxID=1550616 RepID=UPI001CFE2070|nr:C40 family peptidase [Streptomyces bambusae]MCB5165878.1 NlpC/P60 family protein [Streptomyces bambusae]